MYDAPDQPRENRILAALTDEEYQRLFPHLELVYLSPQENLYIPGDKIGYVYFPDNALISMTTLLEDGSTVEVGMIGNEGMMGLPVCWGGKTTITSAIVQVPGNAMRMEAQLLKAEFDRGGMLQSLLLLYTQALFTLVSQTAACNRLHNIEERLCRWLLMVHERIPSEELPLTQEYIANMLGTRRAGVTVAAGILQQAGIIRYSRGKITILDRERLESAACECYQVIKGEYARLLSTDGS